MHEINCLSHEYNERFTYEIEWCEVELSTIMRFFFMELRKNHTVNKH